MQNYAINNNLTPFVSMQNHYNLVYREEEREMLPTLKVRFPLYRTGALSYPLFFLQHLGIGCIPWSPLARGMLTRPASKSKATTRANSDP